MAENKDQRGKWANKIETFLSVLGYIIGLGNLWRFPYMVFRNGGGAFMIPYILSVVVMGLPMFFMETALGQFMRRGGLDCWNIAPILKGVGLGTILMLIYSNIYYVVVLGWAILYFFVSITSTVLPWTTCDNWWNSETCMPYAGDQNSDLLALPNGSQVAMQYNYSLEASPNETIKPTLAVVEFWNDFVLRKSGGIEDMGTLENWPLLLSHIAAWVMCYFCIFKGVKSTGKVVYFTATFPYIVTIILLVRGCTLPGASDGIWFYLNPNITKLAEPQVWVDAASQVIFSYGICFATLITFASFNDFHHDCFRHSIKLVTCCSLTSFLNGLAVFSIVGNLAYVQNITVAELPLSGPGLVFLAIPTALSLMPLPNLWNALFFLMLLLLGVDTQFTSLEGVNTAIFDKWPHIFGKKYRRETFVGVICVLNLVVGIPFIMNGGIYLFELFNNYAVSGISLLFFAMMEAITVGHVYGADRFNEDVKLMIGYKVPIYFKICIKFVVPALTGGIVIFYFIKFQPLKLGEYIYPHAIQVLGWFLCMSSIACVPGYALFRLWNTKASGLKEKLKVAKRPIYTNDIEVYRSEKTIEGSEMEVMFPEKDGK